MINCLLGKICTGLSAMNQRGKFILCFWAKKFPTIVLILFFALPKVIAWVSPNIIYIIFHFIFQSSNLEPIIFASTVTIVDPVVSNNGQSLFVLFVASLQSYNYVVTYSLLTSFILSIVFADTTCSYFVAITAKKVSLFYVLDKQIFL